MGSGWRTLYLKKGRIGLWLPVGIAAWIVFPVIAYLLLPAREGALDKLLPLTPWILLLLSGHLSYLCQHVARPKPNFWIDYLTHAPACGIL